MLQNAVERVQNRFGTALSSATDWALAAAILLGAAIVALLMHAALLWLARRLMGERQTFLRTVLAATKGPTRLGLLLIALAIALPTTPLPRETADLLARLLGLVTICLLGWVALTALHIGADLYLRRFLLDVADNLLARKHVTQVRVFERVLEVVIVLVTIGFALMTFDAVRQFGVTLFASAGVAGLIAGLAARPVLSNFFAGCSLRSRNRSASTTPSSSRTNPAPLKRSRSAMWWSSCGICGAWSCRSAISSKSRFRTGPGPAAS
jgi:small-conductance mechanosensitive channel